MYFSGRSSHIFLKNSMHTDPILWPFSKKIIYNVPSFQTYCNRISPIFTYLLWADWHHLYTLSSLFLIRLTKALPILPVFSGSQLSILVKNLCLWLWVGHYKCMQFPLPSPRYIGGWPFPAHSYLELPQRLALANWTDLGRSFKGQRWLHCPILPLPCDQSGGNMCQ